MNNSYLIKKIYVLVGFALDILFKESDIMIIVKGFNKKYTYRFHKHIR